MAVGKALPMIDSAERVTGATPYLATLRFPEMLVGKVLRSPMPHARIVRLDIEEARRIPGVTAVIGADQLLRDPALQLYYGRAKDQPVVAHERVRHIGEPVALVAAESAELAEAALQRIEVEYDELPAVLDVFDALDPQAPRLHSGYPGNLLNHSKLRHGDLEAGLEAADEIIEETFTSPVAHQAALEPQVAVAQFEDGRLTLWTATQSPYTVRRELAAILGLPEEAVRVIVPPLGGGFGGKGNVRIQPLAAVLAAAAGGRPVRIVLDRAEEFITVTKHAAVIKIRSGVKRDGTLTARQITLHWNAGAYASSSVHLVPAGMFRAVGPYRIPAVSVDSYGVYTNLPPAAAFRGAMTSQTAWAYESHMDTIAHQLGMDPLKLRRTTLLRSGDRFATGETMREAFYVECLEAAVESLERDKPLERRPSAGRQRGRGMAVMMKHTIANSRSECRLELDKRGHVRLYTSTVEMGQGSHTALAQICAEALDLPVSHIQVVGPDTAQTPFDSQTASSRATFMMGNAVINAARDLERQLLEAAAELMSQPPGDLRFQQGRVQLVSEEDSGRSIPEILEPLGLEQLRAEGSFATHEGQVDAETGQGVSSPHWHQGAGACEVEVDLETGQVQVLRYHSSAFAGRVINPNLARLQNDGNVIFGLGTALMEEMAIDGGQVTNANLSDYLIPSILDIPPEMETHLLESSNGTIHGLGEMTLPPVAPAIANAIYDAVGVRLRDLPITPEKVFKELDHGR